MTEEEFQASQSVDSEALIEQGYEQGYKVGMEQGRLVGIEEGKRLGIGDLIERLKNSEPFSQEREGHCLAILNQVARDMLG